jgi:hypothetical protein
MGRNKKIIHFPSERNYLVLALAYLRNRRREVAAEGGPEFRQRYNGLTINIEELKENLGYVK